MKHARPDYDHIQDNSTAIALAQLVMSMSFISDTGLTARSLARQVLRQARIYSDQTAVVTNGTVRCIPADEPVFLVRGQDAVGAATVRAWANLAEAAGAKPDILTVARAHADRMVAWAVKKTPDLPSDPASMPALTAPVVYRVGFTIPEGLHPNTATLVRDFAEAMAKKLRASEIKHGWTANWMRKDWRDELAAELLRHVHKGDPIDVAAYAAFAWFHGWSVAPAETPATSGGQVATIISYTDGEGRRDPAMAGLVMIAIGRDGTHDHVLDRIPEKEAAILCGVINANARSAAPDASATLTYPTEATPALLEALGIPNFKAAPIAHALRAAGADIPRKSEAEQAQVLHWFVKLALQHGNGWWKVAGDEIGRIALAARQKAGGGSANG